MAEITEVLKLSIQAGASDVLLVPGEPPVARVAGYLQKLPGLPAAGAAECRRWIYSLLDERQRAAFERDRELDCALELPGLGRFRLNVYLQNDGAAAALRVVANAVPTADQIELPPAVRALAELPRGLVLVTGPTGSGKTTTLACLVELINQTQDKHVLTIEDPIEFTYKNRRSIIDQREVGRHTDSFKNALKYALRQSPDIILVGEMRDPETMALALSAAETGHLCFSTLHTQNAPSTISRIIDEFPASMHDKIRAQLASVLQAVVSQVLVPRADGRGRVCAREVMVMNSGIAALIRENKIHQIYTAMESGANQGMVTLDQSLCQMLKQGVISIEEALARSQDTENLKRLVKVHGANQADLERALTDPLAQSRMSGLLSNR